MVVQSNAFKSLFCLSIVLFVCFTVLQTTDDMVSSAECSSDDEDFAECEGHAGGLGQLNFACLYVVAFHLQLRIRSSKHRLPPWIEKV